MKITIGLVIIIVGIVWMLGNFASVYMLPAGHEDPRAINNGLKMLLGMDCYCTWNYCWTKPLRGVLSIGFVIN